MGVIDIGMCLCVSVLVKGKGLCDTPKGAGQNDVTLSHKEFIVI